MPSMPRPGPPWKVRRSIVYGHRGKYLAYKRKGIQIVPGSACYFETWSLAMDYATHDGRRDTYAQT